MQGRRTRKAPAVLSDSAAAELQPAEHDGGCVRHLRVGRAATLIYRIYPSERRGSCTNSPSVPPIRHRIYRVRFDISFVVYRASHPAERQPRRRLRPLRFPSGGGAGFPRSSPPTDIWFLGGYWKLPHGVRVALTDQVRLCVHPWILREAKAGRLSALPLSIPSDSVRPVSVHRARYHTAWSFRLICGEAADGLLPGRARLT